MKIAIVGSGPNWQECPFDDLTFDVWSYGLLALELPRVDAVFEMHRREYWPRFLHKAKCSEAEYAAKLSALGKPIFSAEKWEDVANSGMYPYEEVVALVGPHICSSIAYELGFAAHLVNTGAKIEQIGLFGLDLCTYEEWAHQRPNTNRLIGFLQGRGVNVQVPASSKLFGRPFMYGLEIAEDSKAVATEMIEEDIAQMTALMYRWADHTYALKLAEAKRSEGG